jgi:hypothetical protein
MLSAVRATLPDHDLVFDPQALTWQRLPGRPRSSWYRRHQYPQLESYFVAVDPHATGSSQEHLFDLVSKLSIPPTHGFYLSFLIAAGREKLTHLVSSTAPPVSISFAAYYIHQYPPPVG